MNLTRLQTFVEVARRGTFAGAADALSFTPSAVSQQMSKLESELGTHLLEREAGGVRLTEAGRLLHEHAVAIVEAVRLARAGLETFEAERVKRLRLAASPVAAATIVPRALRQLRRRLPGAELALSELPPPAVRDAVAERRVDAGVWAVVDPPADPAVEPVAADPAVVERVPAADPAAVVETVLHREPLCAALPADHPLARLDELDAGALAATPLISGDARWRVDSLATQLALVAAGEGYALVPAPAAEPLPAGVALRPVAGAPEWELRAARPAHEVPSVGTLAVMEALRTAAARERRSRPPIAMLMARA
jgi:DNA-binding transcriptional LysR family regulator